MVSTPSTISYQVPITVMLPIREKRERIRIKSMKTIWKFEFEISDRQEIDEETKF
jgi:hypothetical protein